MKAVGVLSFRHGESRGLRLALAPPRCVYGEVYLTLPHLEASADRSAPIIDGSVKVKPSPMPDLVEEIQKSPRSLNPRV